ncbi:hypothetical protein [Pseudomonas sp. B392_1p]|uniref:hypothetical protein n=1 Tax=Pseudomonas sp. B392_1p TaxID=3457507 RepID=UPI003FD31F3A
MRLDDIRVGLRVMVPPSKVHDSWPWEERYGVVSHFDYFLGIPEISVTLDGELGSVVPCTADELEPE